jgi:hypothetical protein
MMQQIGWSPRKGGKVPTVESDRLCSLFDGALGSLVLYRFEKEQYVQQLEGCVPQNTSQRHMHNKSPHPRNTCFEEIKPQSLLSHIPTIHARKTQSVRRSNRTHALSPLTLALSLFKSWQ